MDPISSTVASGMRARFESLDLLANNLANSGTRAFKADREMYTSYASEESASASGNPTTMPLIQRAWTDFSQGLLEPTGNPLDLAFRGRGFLAVNGPSGVLYTRNGSLQLTAKGELQTTDGYPVRDTKGQPIRLDPAQSIDFDKKGSIRQGGEEKGQLSVVDFENPESLSKRGLSYFSLGEDTKVSNKPTETEVRQGQMESSNVGPAEAAVRLVSVLRQFEALQKALSVTSEMNRRVVEDVAKISG